MFVEYDDIAFPNPQTIGDTASSISGLGPADENMLKTIFIMPNKETDPDATLMIVVDEVTPETNPKTYQYVYVGNINDLPSDVLTESSIVNDLSTGGTDKPLSAEQGRTLNSHVNYTTCGSGASDEVKLISDDGFELSTHLRLLVKMNSTNTHATPKFNINNTGIKDVWYNGAVASDTNTWSAGEVVDVCYDGTKYVASTYGGAQFSTGEKVKEVGIDSEPTAGSNNLVKSGGVYGEINQLNQKTYKDLNIIPSPSYEIGYFYYNGINKTGGANWECAIIPIDGVTHLLIKTNMYGDIANCCITDASDNVLVSWKQADLVNNLIDVELSQYSGASKLYFSVYQNGGFVYGDAFVYGTKPVASKENIVRVEEEISGAISIDSGELVAGLVTPSSAPDFISGGLYRTTDFLPVNVGDKIVAKCAVSTGGYAITCYSSNTQSSYVAGTGVVGVDDSTLNDYEITIPNGVNYIRVTTDSEIEGFDGTILITKYSDDGIIPRIEKLEGEILNADEEPTAGSDNLVKSGGVAQKMQLLINDSIAPNWNNYELEDGFYYSGTSEGAGSGWKRCKIDVSSASILKFRTNLYGSTADCCITDAEGNVLKTWILADLPTDKFVIFDLSSLTNPKYFYYSVFLNNFTEDDVYIKALADIASLHELKDAESYATGYEEVESGELSNVLILTNNAPTETASPGYRTTDYISVSEGDIIKVLSYCSNGAFVITGYASKSQDSYVSSFSVYGKADIETAEWFFAKIPNGVNYIRVSCSKNYLVNKKIVIKREVADSIDARLFPIDGRQLVFLNNPYLIDVKGTLVSSGGNNYYCSDFIELNECDSYKLSGIRGGYGCLWVSFYSLQNQADFIGQAITGDDGTAERTIVFTVPKGGKYARFCGSYGLPHPQPVSLVRANEGYRIAANESKLLPSNRTLLDFPRTASRKPMILFQMDMAKVAYSQKIIDYADILEANGVKRSTYNVLPEYLGHDTYTNFDFWMNTLFNRGNEVALHTGPDYNFYLNSTMTDAQVEAAMKDYLDRLEAKGYKITGFIPLGAELKQSFKPIIKKYMNWMLSGDGPTGNVPGDVDLMEDNVMDFISSLQTDRFQILRIDLECVHTDASAEMHAAMLQKAKDVVDETIERGGYTIFYSHTYNQTFGTTYTLYPELFIPLCEYIKSKIDERQIVTGNTNEMLEWYYTQRVGE